jgi:hypothetical protein
VPLAQILEENGYATAGFVSKWLVGDKVDLLTPEDEARVVSHYDGEIRFTDEMLGPVFEDLERGLPDPDQFRRGFPVLSM